MGSRRHRIGINLLPIIPNLGGIRTHTHGLLAGLTDLNPPEDIVLFVNQELTSHLDVPFEIVETGVRSSSRPLRYSYEQFILPHRAGQANVDMLHCPGYTVPLLANVPTVVTIHDVNYQTIPETFSRISRFVWKQLVPRSAESAAAVITVSEFTQSEIKRHIGIPHSKINIIPNAPSPTLPSSPPSIDDIDIQIDPPYLLYVSSTHPHKNHVALVRALPDLPKDFSLVFVGPKRDANKDLHSLVETMDLAERVTIPGFVSDTTLAALYANAHIYVHPSLYEGFGIPVLEAMRYGTPVACSDVASLPEICGDAALYFDPDSPADIAEVCQKIINSEGLQDMLTERGKKRVAEYTWTKTAERTLEVCRSVIS